MQQGAFPFILVNIEMICAKWHKMIVDKYMQKIKYILLMVLLCTCIKIDAQLKRNELFDAYIEQYKDIAIKEMAKYGIPASITLAQGLLESGAGQSRLAVFANNHFGIKCHDWQGAKMYKDDDERNECFRSYDNPLQSFEDHSSFLVNKVRYRSLFSLNTTDYKGWAYGLKGAGYATNPNYAHRLIDIIECYELYRFDTMNASSVSKNEILNTQTVVSENASLHAIYMYNDNYYLNVRKGDTFKSLAKELNISARKLAHNNERSLNSPLEVGEIIYLKRKKHKADKQFKGKPYVVKEGDSMYNIAQRYGIRLESLYYMNGFMPDYVPTVGEKIRVY